MLMLGVGAAIAKHGEPKDGPYSAPLTIFAVGLEIGLLYWGGFFG